MRGPCIMAVMIPMVLPKNNLLNKVLSYNVLTKFSNKFYTTPSRSEVNKKINTLSINNRGATDLLLHLKAKLPYASFSPSPYTSARDEEFLQ